MPRTVELHLHDERHRGAAALIVGQGAEVADDRTAPGPGIGVLSGTYAPLATGGSATFNARHEHTLAHHHALIHSGSPEC